MSPELDDLLDEVRLLWHVAVQATERLHDGEAVTVGMRAVLEFLARNGPRSVPDIARSRLVTRQHIQSLVNGLLELRLVSLEDNPAHRRSSLVQLAPEGEDDRTHEATRAPVPGRPTAASGSGRASPGRSDPRCGSLRARR